MKRIHVSEHLPLSPDAVRALIVAPDTWRTADTGDVEVAEGPEAVTLTVLAPLSSLELPQSAAAFVSSAAHLVQTITVPHDFPAGPARYRAEVPGLPVELSAAISARAAGEGTEVTVDAEAASSMPLLGSMIEDAAATAMERRFRDKLSQAG